jgi:hypothetical protein
VERPARNLALFNLAIDSKLRGCDLVQLQIDDISVGGRVRDRATIVQKKTGRPMQFEITYDTHSMRRTKAVQIYKKTGNLRAVQLLLGHTKLESTVRYLGIEVDDALAISEQVELQAEMTRGLAVARPRSLPRD